MQAERVIKTENQPIALKVSLTALMSALTTVMTMIVSVYIPASSGFFNIGESMVYLSAILFGPYIGALSGGLGSMAADLLLGFPNYAPGTLVIKGIEGFVVGYLYKRLKSGESSKKDKILASIFVSAITIAGVILYLTISNQEYTGFGNLWEITMPAYFNTIFWVLLSSFSTIIIVLLVLRKKLDRDLSNKIISTLAGGFIIVVGYLFYGYLLYGSAAFIEIPFNLMQCLVGMAIAIPISTQIKKSIRKS